MHLIFTSLAVHLLARTSVLRPLLPARRGAAEARVGPLYLRAVVPTGICHAAALAAANLALARLSVASTRIAAAGTTPLATLLADWALALDEPDPRRVLLACAVIPGAGLALSPAAVGDVPGPAIVLQVAAVGFEAIGRAMLGGRC